jgi:hypothetical protein
VLSGRVQFIYRHTEDLWADILTKPVMGAQFRKLVSQIAGGLKPSERPELPDQPINYDKEQHLID